MITGEGKVGGATGHRRDIEGLRAIAVTLVVLFHLGVPGFDGGYVGVDVFFVVSGFLITSTLLSDTERNGRLSLTNFYARRARRLLPISAVVLVATAIASAIILEPGRMHDVGVDTVAAGLFSSNWVFAGRATDYLASAGAPSPMQHYWSLSLEEQFYVVWPVLLMIGSLVDRRMRKKITVPAMITVITVASFVVSVMLTADNPGYSYFGLHTRAWELGLGALIAVFAGRTDYSKVKFATPVGAISVTAIIFAGVSYGAPIDFPGWVAAIPVVATGALIVTGNREGNRVARALGNRVFHFIGARSYSLYLWHWPVIILMEAKVVDVLSGPQQVLAMAITFVLAEAGFRLVENPVRYSKTLTKSRLRTLAVGGLAMAVVASSGVVLANYEKRVTSGYVAEDTSIYAGTKTLDEKVAVLRSEVRSATLPMPLPDNLEPNLYDVAVGGFSTELGECFQDVHTSLVHLCQFGDPEGDRTLAMFGDSHLAQWFGALNGFAKEHHYKLRVYMHPGCSITGIETMNIFSLASEPWCPPWRDASLVDMAKRGIDYVIMTNNFFLFSAKTRKEITADHWAQGMQETVSKLTAFGALPIYLGDNPKPPPDLLQCLVHDLSDVSKCFARRSESTRSDFGIAGRQLIEAAGGLYIDLADLMCSAAVCPAVVGNKLLYRDWSHLTKEATELMMPVVGGMIQDYIDKTS